MNINFAEFKSQRIPNSSIFSLFVKMLLVGSGLTAMVMFLWLIAVHTSLSAWNSSDWPQEASDKNIDPFRRFAALAGGPLPISGIAVDAGEARHLMYGDGTFYFVLQASPENCYKFINGGFLGMKFSHGPAIRESYAGRFASRLNHEVPFESSELWHLEFQPISLRFFEIYVSPSTGMIWIYQWDV